MQILKKHLEWIVRKQFGKKGLRRLQFIRVSKTHYFTNLFYVGNAKIRFFASIHNGTRRIFILIVGLGTTDLHSILSNRGKDIYYDFYKDDTEPYDYVYRIEYRPGIFEDFYRDVKYILDNIEKWSNVYYGDGRTYSRVHSTGTNILVQGNESIGLDTLVENYTAKTLVEKVNYLRSLNLQGVEMYITQ